MYSRWEPAPGVGKIRIKEPMRRRTDQAWYCGDFVADCLGQNTWVVWNMVDGLVAAIFYGESNTHDWSPPKAHARSYLNRFSTVNPFELDNIA